MKSRTKKQPAGQQKPSTEARAPIPLKNQPPLSAATPLPTGLPQRLPSFPQPARPSTAQPQSVNLPAPRMTSAGPTRIQPGPANPISAALPKIVPSRPPQTPMDDVQFVLDMPRAKSVGVAGTFNDWNPGKTPMKRGADTIWRTRVMLPAGRHEYRFVVDGQWLSDPKARESVPNPYGGTNSVIVLRRPA